MRWPVAISIVVALAGCGSAPQRHDALQAFDVEAPPADAPPAHKSAAGAPAPIAVAVPQMAYTYRYGFRLPNAAIRRAQAAHVALCDRLGPARCQILSLSSGGGEGDASQAMLKLRVASPDARALGRDLQAAIAGAGGRMVSDSITAEDVSKDIVDTQARLKQRTLLVERLTDILRTRTGKVGELVEAERSVAAAQEEIDQARGWLAELRSRVAMSTVVVTYATVAAEPAPRSAIGDALAGSLATFVTGVTTLTVIAIMLAPWLILAVIMALIWHRLVAPWRRRRQERAQADE